MENKQDYTQAVLPNGLRIVAVPDDRLHYFTIGAYVAMGPRFEPLAHTGISHFIEHMLFQGSQKYPTSEDITRAADRITGQIAASTSPEYAYFALAVHRKYAGQAIEILAELLQRPRFELDEIEHEKKIVLEERAQFHDRAQRNLSVDELLYNLLTRSREQDVSLVGTAANIGQFDRDMVRNYWKQFFTAGNTVLVAAGGFEPDAVAAKIANEFEPMPAGRPAEPQAAENPRPGPEVVFRRQDSPMLTVALAWRAVSFDHPDYAAYAALSEFLGAGTSSRLFTRIREELGLVYDISSGLVTGSHFGWLQIDTTVSRSNYVATLDEILNVVDEFVERPADEQELAVCREKLRCGLEIAHDDPAETAAWYGKQTLLLPPDRILSLQDELRQIEELSMDQLVRVARSTFTPDGCHLVAVGPINWFDRRRTRRLVRSRLGVAPLVTGPGRPPS